MKKSLIFVLPLLAVSGVAFGQAPIRTEALCNGGGAEGEVICMGARIIIVEGSALRDPMGDNAYEIEKIDLRERRSESLENILRDVAGLQQFRRSDARTANPTSQGITLRGLGGNASSRSLLILDGVPQGDPFGGWVSWPGYDALNLLQARVRRGGGSGADGPGAIAGTVELFSNNSNNTLRGGIAYGSRNSVDADLLFTRNLGQGNLSISANYASGDGFIPIVENQRGTIDRPAEYEQAGLAVRYVAPLSDNTELQANVRAFADDRERGFAFSENHNDGADASIRIVKRDPGGWQWSALGYVQIRNFDVSFGGVAADRNSVNRVFEQFNVPSTGLGARFEVRPPVGRNAELRIGGDWRRTEGVTNENFFFLNNDTPRRSRRAGGSTSTYGTFVEASVKANSRLTFTGGGRVDFWSIDDGFRREIELINPFPGAIRNDTQFADRSGTEFTGRAGFHLEATGDINLRGAAYLGWRLPTLNELFRPFRVGADATAANELLEPERVKGAELGLDWNSGNLNVSVTGFYNQLDKAIANVTLANGPGLFPGVGFVSGAGVFRQRQNLDAVESRGVEVNADYGIYENGDSLTFRASYSYVDAEVRASGSAAALNGLRPAQIPKHNATAGVHWKKQSGTGGSLSLRYIGSQFEDDQNSRRLKDALTIDGRIACAISDKLTLEGRVENLFDARVETAISSSGIVERAFPQTFWIGLRAKIE